MLQTILTLALLFSIVSAGQAQTSLGPMAAHSTGPAWSDEVLAPLIDIYADVNAADLVDEHYWLQLTATEPELSRELHASARCKQSQNYVAASATSLTATLLSQIQEGIQIGFQGTPVRATLDERARNAVELLRNALATTTVTVCIDDTTPAYSDEHVVHFVRVDHALRLIFAMGRPD